MLKDHRIEALVDVRRFPTSKVEHFKEEALTQWLTKQGIEYIWLGEPLGGYRHGGYKAYMRAKLFRDGIERLSAIARQKRTCIMRLEQKPKYCHRRFISAHLESEDNRVVHITTKG
jgi:uncharacterized protein (DUF488 family)